MSSTKEQVSDFIDKCEELKKCKFIMATTKIKDLLKCIVNSPELYRLFDTVTKDFDYVSEKRNCLITESDGILRKSYVVLPQTVGRRLAFIFCLLVEFDKDTINFNDFLRLYFPEDGSYYASYHAFCSLVIDSLEDMLCQVFKEQLSSPEDGGIEDGRIEDYPEANPARSKLVSEISLSIAQEMQFILQSNIPKEEKEGGYKLLTELNNAVRSGNESLIDALVCGYNYYILYHRCVSDNIAPLIETLAEFEEVL